MSSVDSNFIRVNGQKIKCPSKCTWGLQDVSKSDAGRDETALMHKGLVARKVTLQLSWSATTPEETYDIIHAFTDHEYFSVSYYDPYYCRKATDRHTGTFYRGDASAPFYWFYPGKERFSEISFDIIER